LASYRNCTLQGPRVRWKWEKKILSEKMPRQTSLRKEKSKQKLRERLVRGKADANETRGKIYR